MESHDSEIDRIKSAYRRRSDPGRYSAFDRAHLWALHEVERQALSALNRSGRDDLSDSRILDVGCGGGYWLRHMLDWGARSTSLHGIDAIGERLEQARSNLPAGVTLVEGNAEALPWPAAHFDMVSQFVVFSSILSAEHRRQLAGEMVRVLKPDGMILWYDFRMNNPRNPDVSGVRASEIRSLFPGFHLDVRRVTLAPPIARRVAPVSSVVHGLLAAVPWLRTHLLIGLRRAV